MSASGDGNLSVQPARLLSSGLSLIAAELHLKVEQARPQALRIVLSALALAFGTALAALCIVLAAVSPLLLQWSSVEALALSIAACAGLALVGFVAAFWTWKRRQVPKASDAREIAEHAATASNWRAPLSEMGNPHTSATREGTQP